MDEASFVRAADGGTEIRLKIVPGGSRDAVLGPYGSRLRVKVRAPPEGGKANRAVVRLLAARLGIGARSIRIVHGQATPLKTLHVEGIAPAPCAARVLGAPPGP